MPEHPDLTRLREEYQRRAQRPELGERYSLFNPAYLFTIQQRQRSILKLLDKAGCCSLKDRRILEVGCGGGGVLLECLQYGALAQNLHGIDLLYDRLRSAHQTLMDLPLVCADGQNIPYTDQAFDLTMQFTVFSSILDDQIRVNLANEIHRVTKSDGLIIWSDFWTNPTNPQTSGVRPAAIKALFPNCTVKLDRITLAPPLARRLLPISWEFCVFLERLRLFNTHYLALIQPKMVP